MPTPPKPSLRFPLSPSLRTRTLKTLSRIDSDPGVNGMIIQRAARQTAGLGVAGAVRVMTPIVRSVLGGADAAQLRAVSKHIRGLMA